MSTTPQSTASPANIPAWPSALVILAAGSLCYANSLDGPFLFDDTQPTGELALAPEQLRPITRLSLALNRAISGQETWSYHLLNVLVHLAAGLVLLALLRRTIPLCAPRLSPRTSSGLALSSALIWLVHPLQTAAVSYISQRAEAMAALFYLAFLYAYVRSISATEGMAWLVLALVALALGLATKEIVATAPVLAWLLHAVVLAPASERRFRATWRFQLALVLSWGALLAVFIAPPLFTRDTSAGFGLRDVTPLEYARSQPGVILHYLRLAFWPHPQCLDYSWPVARETREIVPQALAISALIAATFYGLVRRAWLGLAGAWFFVILAPTSSFVPIQDLAFEHRMYLPLAAVVVPTVAGAWWLCGRAFAGARRLPQVLAIAAVASLAAATVRRNQDYRDEVVMWQSVVACRPDNARAYENLSGALIRAGRPDEAIAALETALRLRPSGLAYNNLAVILINAERLDEAIPVLSQAIQLDPSYALSLHNLGNCYLRKGELDRAIECYQRALELFGAPYTHRDIGIAYANKGAYEEAEAHFRKALELDPSDPVTRQGLEHVERKRAEAKAPRPDEGRTGR